MRDDPAALGQPPVAVGGVGGRDRRQVRPHPRAQRLGLGGQVDADGPVRARERQAGHPLGPLTGGAEEGPQRERAAVVEMRVVLPRVADAAEHLDAVVRAADGGVHRDQHCHRGRELTVSGTVAVAVAVALAACRVLERPRGVPGRGGGLLRRREHPGAAVLDPLELADRPAELVADLRVRRRGGHRPVGDATGLGRQQGRGQGSHHARPQPAEHPAGGHGQVIHADPPGRAGEVESLQRRDLDIGGIQRHPDWLVISDGRDDHQVGLARTGDRPAVAVDHQLTLLATTGLATTGLATTGLATTGLAAPGRPGGDDSRREPDRPGQRAARHVLDQPARGVGPGAVQDGAGEHGRQEGSRHQGPSQLFHGDRQLRQPVALAAE